MLLTKFLKEVDLLLQSTFNDNSLSNKQWFLTLESIIEKQKPAQFYNIKSYDLVLYYVRFKYMEFLNE